MASLKKFLVGNGFRELPLQRTRTDHLALEGTLNGFRGRFILDTGASNTCVGLHRMEYFGLLSEVSEIRAAGAGATDMETLVSEGNVLVFEEWECADLQVVLFDLSHVNQALESQEEPPVDGILGADILHGARAVIDYETCSLYLR
ncbi:retropepsin-like aspartic protease [Robiginitalea sp. SC105]|uniref:retropepsin-like aspartic protease n=1 Tax=Robiginitalea sp. SC105 TaxID=2762332 RepID=UPI00163A028D|nr:retropepsin-like aspartic protease [Robiginitalea sp. SC105]MBC2838718.1 clan AA aspartic protease [Robiginitalea sp. SC105]